MSTGMYIHVHVHVYICIYMYMYMYIHEPCVQQGRPGGVAIYNVYVGIQCRYTM